MGTPSLVVIWICTIKPRRQYDGQVSTHCINTLIQCVGNLSTTKALVFVKKLTGIAFRDDSGIDRRCDCVAAEKRNGLTLFAVVAKRSSSLSDRIVSRATDFLTQTAFTQIRFSSRLFNNRTVLNHAHSHFRISVNLGPIELLNGTVVRFGLDFKAIRHYSRR